LLVTVAALMYHDVTPGGSEAASGFPGGDAARYKLTPNQFDRHLDTIGQRIASPILTFDDGGISASDYIAAALERRGWRGHFFVTTGYLDRPGFLDRARVRDLHTRGHVIGTHSHSHPLRMANCSEARLREEWKRSTSHLAGVLGAPILTASVPGGDYSTKVAVTAAEAGIRLLFTSRPTVRVTQLADLSVVGRYAIQASTTAATAAALAAGDYLPRARWAALWMAKQACKQAAGSLYLRVRARLLHASPGVRWGDSLPDGLDDLPQV
jgi:peptidoglycan/xylan/chitin deacetylase (PgdA/CDA1 family)